MSTKGHFFTFGERIGPNDWSRKLPYGKIAVTTGGDALGTDTILRNRVLTRHERLGRQLERDKGLTDDSINPAQYVRLCSIDVVL